MSDPVKLSVVPLGQEREQLRLRIAPGNVISVCFDVQQFKGWSDEQMFGQAACYLADQLEATAKKYHELLNRFPPEPITVGGKTYVYTGPPWQEVSSANR